METKINRYYNDAADCAVMEIIGDYPSEDSQIDGIFRMISETLKEYDTKKIILDYSKITYSLTIEQIINGPERAKKFNLNDESLRVAVVFDYNSQAYKNYRLCIVEFDTKKFLKEIRTVYRTFGSFDDALSWMKGND